MESNILIYDEATPMPTEEQFEELIRISPIKVCGYCFDWIEGGASKEVEGKTL
mgnify:FL=1